MSGENETAVEADTRTIFLKKPAKHGDAKVTFIELHEPTAGELKRCGRPDDGTAWNINLIAIVSGYPPLVIEQLCMRDYSEAVAYLEGFTSGSGPKTGN